MILSCLAHAPSHDTSDGMITAVTAAYCTCPATLPPLFSLKLSFASCSHTTTACVLLILQIFMPLDFQQPNTCTHSNSQGAVGSQADASADSTTAGDDDEDWALQMAAAVSRSLVPLGLQAWQAHSSKDNDQHSRCTCLTCTLAACTPVTMSCSSVRMVHGLATAAMTCCQHPGSFAHGLLFLLCAVRIGCPKQTEQILH
jgi:hypothetical protein